MLDQYKILTVTHKYVDLKDISKYLVDEGDNQLQERLADLMSFLNVEELFYLNTCNRVMYFFYGDVKIDEAFKEKFLSFVQPNLDGETIQQCASQMISYEGMTALTHLYEVSASIDSLVVGEREILRQIKQAYEKCDQWKMIGHHIRLAIDQVIVSAKMVYSQTKIGEKALSVVALAFQKFLSHKLQKDAKILIVGAGQTNTLFVKFLVKYGFHNLTVFNRTEERAVQLAKMADNGKALGLNSLGNYKEAFDTIVVCTGATEPIITKALYQELIGEDDSSKVVIDLSIPHNVSNEVVEAFNVSYIEIEGIKALAKDNLAFREKEVINAKYMLSQQLAKFPSLFKSRQLELAFSQIPKEIKAVRQKAIQEVFYKEIESLDEESKDLIERMMKYMEKKCIGIPMKAAREAVIAP